MRGFLLGALVAFSLSGCPQPSDPEDAGGTDGAPADGMPTDARIDAPGCASADRDDDGVDSIACGGLDCDDDDANRSPEATEVCDVANLDEDCSPTTFGERDMDGDGRFDAACCNGTACGDDCDDTRAGVNPAVPEVCDLIDNDCDTRVDEATTPVPWYPDTDGDDFGDPDGTPVSSCEPVAGHAFIATDCDDTDPSVNPATAEVCNGIDDDCSGEVDEGFGTSDYYPDCDGDGRGAEGPAPAPGCAVPLVRPVCGAATGNWVTSHDDCDDTRASAVPGAAETCNGLDDNCNGIPDDGSAATAWCNDPARGFHTTAATCTGGACAVVSCAAPYLDCSSGVGCETDGSSTTAHCTACGNSCNWGVCSAACDPVEVEAGVTVCARRISGSVVCWGNRTIGDGVDHGGAPVTRPGAPVLSVAGAIDVDVGGNVGNGTACAATASGDVWCWGRVPIAFGAGARLAPIDVGDGALEVSVDNGSWCWRTATSVICTTSLRTVTLPGVTDAVQIALGPSEVCWRRASGTVTCSVNLTNSSATLGMVDVPGLTDAVAIDAADSFCAARAGGTVVCWTASGGVSATTVVTGAAGAIDVAVGADHACLRRANGTLACWGDNGSGQLGGVGGPGIVEVAGVTDALSITAGEDSTCARRRAGIHCWGWNGLGQLGNGTTDAVPHTTPTAVLAPP